MSCRKNFLITESDKSHILSLYGLISEQESEQKSMDIKSSTFFGSGVYSENYLNKQELMTELKSAILFLKKYNGKTTKITITASEDSNPNYDNEKNPPIKLERGELAKLRAETMQKFLEATFKEFVDRKELRAMPIFDPPKLLVGNSTDKSKDRYVNVNFIVSGSDYDCLNGLVIGFSFEKSMGKHKCNNAIYEVRINDILLTSTENKQYATLNNGNGIKNSEAPPILEPLRKDLTDGDPGGFRRNYFIITPEIAQQLLKPNSSNIVPTSFNISLTCKNANDIDSKIPIQSSFNSGCHPDVGRMTFTNPNIGLKPTSLDKKPPAGRGENEVFVTIDACGNIINKGT